MRCWLCSCLKWTLTIQKRKIKIRSCALKRDPRRSAFVSYASFAWPLHKMGTSTWAAHNKYIIIRQMMLTYISFYFIFIIIVFLLVSLVNAKLSCQLFDYITIWYANKCTKWNKMDKHKHGYGRKLPSIRSNQIEDPIQFNESHKLWIQCVCVPVSSNNSQFTLVCY